VPSLLNQGDSLETAAATTGLIVGSPAQVVEKIELQREAFGDYQRQLFAFDFGGQSEQLLHEHIDVLGEHVLPLLRESTAVSAAGTR
jgi:alkanesulfonate monooxygenase SsuD/methylene tetrahydromethanopterin reductase-like flavin-dependent oxidoreductase (luciferase family)